MGDEATYAMQALSLAHDLDLAYSRADYDRFVALWGGQPDGLVLQSRDGGRHLTYGKPSLYALAVAPFVRLAPVRGALVANALFLAWAAVAAGRALRRHLGAGAPWWVAAFVFASVAFAYVFWVHADLFLLATAAVGLALAYGGDRGAGARPGPARHAPGRDGGPRLALRRPLARRRAPPRRRRRLPALLPRPPRAGGARGAAGTAAAGVGGARRRGGRPPPA